MPKTTYKDLAVWQRSIDLVCEVYVLSRRLPKDERFGLIAQIRRTAVSIPSNIAEGSGRHGRGELLHHLSFSRGSLKELETQIEIAVRLGYLTRDQVAKARELCDEVSRLLYGMRRKLAA